jgi:HEAT repeat protein
MPLEAPGPRRASAPLEVAPPRPDLRLASGGELVELLDDKELRLGAALELCRRVEVASVGPIFGALRRMARGEAVRLLPATIRFGERAVVHLVDLLRSRKAYLRQGSALALGILKSGDGIDPLVELLLSEPTDIWREVARALGETAGGAVMSLAARARDPEAQGAEARDRLAWALAHAVAKGARGAVETLAAGRDPTAAQVARRALELAASARDNDAEVRGAAAPGDQTVNRAFSRRFFEALGSGAAGASGELSGSVPLDDEDLLESDEELVDDDDILPS